MTSRPCPCCAWTVHVPEERDDAVAACPECGQVLHVPPPWADRDIASCDTRDLVSGSLRDFGTRWAPDVRSPVPAELSMRRVRPPGQKRAEQIHQGLLGIILGLFVLSSVFWFDRPGANALGGRLISACAGLLLVIGGAYTLRIGIRRWRREVPARVVPLSGFLPPDGYDLGTPLAYYRTRTSATAIQLVMGALILGAGAGSLGLMLTGQASLRFLRLGVIGTLGGAAAVLHVLRSPRGQRVLLFSRGLVVGRGSRTEVWRWDEVTSVGLEIDPSLRPLIAYGCRLRRGDGEECVLNAGMQFFENQLTVRAQAEVCARLLPEWRRTLRSGGRIDFGVVELAADGLYRNGQFLPLADISVLHADADKLTLRTTGGRSSTWPVARVPNLAGLVFLLRELCATRQTTPTRAVEV